eukprot:CAMPEP_0197840200 /NCGR_PEP_ID=MMETSP1437-20131217/45469_1 /TAXON_ID=49252 ORGANISM="Eucampia antarctica, Strain CCMP1452" /NCGR_SAMPLE_ID=MMETSP1437 /ASSEMBLY_ACC=CAM_ASM_001096 /LENGTH=358 /DNA_ID=CAMNT_0043449771 /DNA_START=391 /DNA_END=1467 /DNA_ORIENTATION=-
MTEVQSDSESARDISKLEISQIQVTLEERNSDLESKENEIKMLNEEADKVRIENVVKDTNDEASIVKEIYIQDIESKQNGMIVLQEGVEEENEKWTLERELMQASMTEVQSDSESARDISKLEISQIQVTLEERNSDLESKENEIKMLNEEADKVRIENITLSQNHSIGLEENNKKTKEHEDEKENLKKQIEALTMSTVVQASASSEMMEEIKKHYEEEMEKWTLERELMQASTNEIEKDMIKFKKQGEDMSTRYDDGRSHVLDLQEELSKIKSEQIKNSAPDNVETKNMFLEIKTELDELRKKNSESNSYSNPTDSSSTSSRSRKANTACVWSPFARNALSQPTSGNRTGLPRNSFH